MRIDALLRQKTIELADAELLLGHVLGKNRSWIFSHHEYELTEKEQNDYHRLEQRRSAHEPVAYLTGTKEFFGRDFSVTKDTLIPRPATEGLVELTLEYIRNPVDGKRTIDAGIVAVAWKLREGHPGVILDIGTGSGCIGITLAVEESTHRVIAVDISDKALSVAKKNAVDLGCDDRISFRHQNGIDAIDSMNQSFLIVSNPPYIPEGTVLMPSVLDFEPHLALFAGKDGLSVIRTLIDAAQKSNYCTGIIFECREDQVPAIDALIRS